MKPAMWKATLAAIAVLSLVRVASTHRIFSQIIDEPPHIGAGFQWLSGRTVFDVDHPPLERVLSALPLKLSSVTEPAETDWIRYGNQLLGSGRDYAHNLALARLGNLLLFGIGLVSIGLWARRVVPDGG
ncbi:MAG: hypothetical protein ABI837_10595, partial [Acidobacteriota bacterium]